VLAAMTNTVACVAVVVFAVFAVAAIVWWALRMARETRVASERMHAATDNLHDRMDEEAIKYELVALYSAGPNADPIERAQHINDSSVEWASLLFSRYAGVGADLVYDRGRATWIASVPLFDGGPPVAFTLAAVDARKPMDALAAAVGLVVVDAPPVIESGERPSTVCVRYEQVGSHWKVFQPCEECGGGWLRTHFADASFASLARWTAQTYLVGADPFGAAESDEPLACAHCLAREMRACERICHQPTCWYDTVTEQWMLSESLGEEIDAICVPLGIETFFVNQRVILAAANHQLGI
jgi:hypothetical protein